MTIIKRGTGKVLGEKKATASQGEQEDWTEQDQAELDQENEESDK